jgi:hypothetical protein
MANMETAQIYNSGFGWSTGDFWDVEGGEGGMAPTGPPSLRPWSTCLISAMRLLGQVLTQPIHGSCR